MGAGSALPDVPAAHAVDRERVAPCSRLACARCGEHVVDVEGVSLVDTGAGALEGGRPSCDPLAWLALGEPDPDARTYACACSRATIRAPIAAVDRGWACAGHDASRAERDPTRRAMRSWPEAIAARLPDHLRRGGWLALEAAYEGLADGRVRRHAWTSDESRDLDEAETRTWCARIAELGAWSVSRQLAPPTWTERDLYAAIVEGWKHGDLDSQSVASTHRDVPSLVAALRALARTQRGSSSIALAFAPGVLHPPGPLAPEGYR